jgi:hypothetical protein
MHIHIVDRGTPLEIEVQTYGGERIANMKAVFYDSQGRMSLTVDCEALFDHYREPKPGTKLYISFYREQLKYSFEGVFASGQEQMGKKMVNITMLSNIKTESRRTVKRFEIYVKISIYALENGQKGPLLGEGETNDVTFDAFSVASDVDIPVSDDKPLALEFTLFNKHSFFLPAKILKKSKASVVSAMTYEYVFLFNYTDRPNEKDRLISAFFKELTR